MDPVEFDRDGRRRVSSDLPDLNDFANAGPINLPYLLSIREIKTR